MRDERIRAFVVRCFGVSIFRTIILFYNKSGIIVFSCGRKGFPGIMNRQWQKKSGYVRWGLWISGILFLSACGENSADHNMAADTLTVEEEQVTQESEQDDADELPQAENSEEPEESEETQEEAESEDLAVLNEKRFYEGAEILGLNREEAAVYYQKLCEDNVFQNDTVWLAGFNIDDIDQNGQPDLVVMIQEEEYNYYGEGCMYFYMNEDEAYCFRDEEFPFFFGFNTVGGDFDNDGYIEIAFESLGTGVGGAGDWHPRILKYKDHTMEPMDFPFDENEYADTDMPSVHIMITQEAEADTYSAYCAYMDETIVFEAENLWEPEGIQECGRNSRGYFNMQRGEYEGRDALEVSELLYGEGGTSNIIGFAEFLIVWDQDGEGRIVEWWIEPL